jgi:hypothetical protein
MKIRNFSPFFGTISACLNTYRFRAHCRSLIRTDLNTGINQCCGSGIRCIFDPWIRDPGSGMGKKSGSGIRCLFDLWIRDPASGMGKKSGSGSEMNDPDRISESLEKNFWVKILAFFDADPGSEMEKIRNRDSGG